MWVYLPRRRLLLKCISTSNQTIMEENNKHVQWQTLRGESPLNCPWPGPKDNKGDNKGSGKTPRILAPQGGMVTPPLG